MYRCWIPYIALVHIHQWTQRLVSNLALDPLFSIIHYRDNDRAYGQHQCRYPALTANPSEGEVYDWYRLLRES